MENADLNTLYICSMPQLLPDELLYSFVGRLAAENSLGSPKRQVQALFGNKNIIPSIDLPSALTSLQKRLGTNSPWRSVLDMINIATLYPYHRPFLTPSRDKLVESILFDGGGKALKVLMGRVANGFGAADFLRYCTVCTGSDINTYGTPYWHRSHQLPGVTTCYLHGCELLVHNPSSSYNRQRFLFVPSFNSSTKVCAQGDPAQVSFAILSNDLLVANLLSLIHI